MEKIIGRTFRSESVDLENCAFEKCTFINCEIRVDRGNFSLINCDLSDCRLSLGKYAVNIAQLLMLFYPDMPIYVEGKETKEQVLQRMKKKLQDEGVI
jgi:hypothetical protein